MNGREIIAAIKKASTWGTAVAAGAGDGLLLLSDNVTHSVESIDDESMGIDFVENADSGAIAASIAPEAYLRYEGLDVLIAMVCGTAGAPSQQAATAAYANSYQLAASIDGLFGTLALLKNTASVHEIASCKPIGFTIKGEAGQPLKITFDMLGDDLTKDVSVTNTAATMANVTYPDKSNRVLFRQGVFRENDETGAALGAGDKIYPKSFELTFKRAATGEIVAGADSIDEPDEGGFAEITLKLEFPRYQADTPTTDWRADTRKKMDITFTGATIEGAYDYTFMLSFPRLEIVSVEEPATGPSKIPQSVSYKVKQTDAAPTGMSVTKPMQIDVINKRTTDPLA